MKDLEPWVIVAYGAVDVSVCLHVSGEWGRRDGCLRSSARDPERVQRIGHSIVFS